MNQNTKRLILLNLPYILTGLYTTNLGWAWRMATGADLSEKMQSLLNVLPDALGRIIPSVHPAGPAGGLMLWRWSAFGSLPQGQERQEVPPWQRIRLGPLECIILSVKNSTWTHRRICT